MVAQIDVPCGLGQAAQGRRHLGPDLVAGTADRGPQVDIERVGAGAERADRRESRLNDAGRGAPPAGVGEAEGAAVGIDEEDGHTVGDGDGEQNAGLGRDDGVGLAEYGDTGAGGAIAVAHGGTVHLTAARDARHVGGPQQACPAVLPGLSVTEVESGIAAGDPLQEIGKAGEPIDLAEDAQLAEPRFTFH